MDRRTVLGMIGIGFTTVTAGVPRIIGNRDPNEETNTPILDRLTAAAATENRWPTEYKHISTDTDIVVGEETLSKVGARMPHAIVFDNTTEKQWVGRLLIQYPDGSVALEETYVLGPETEIVVTLSDPRRYTVRVDVQESDVSEFIDVKLTWFDCNDSSTRAAIQPDGSLKTTTLSTTVDCENVETRRISSTDDVSISFGDGPLTDRSDRKPYGVTLTNPTNETWTARLVITQTENILLDGLYTLESEAKVTVTLTEPDHYHGTASIPAKGVAAAFDVKPEQFDCNHSSTTITVQPDGALAKQMASTLMACSPNTEGENEPPRW